MPHHLRKSWRFDIYASWVPRITPSMQVKLRQTRIANFNASPPIRHRGKAESSARQPALMSDKAGGTIPSRSRYKYVALYFVFSWNVTIFSMENSNRARSKFPEQNLSPLLSKWSFSGTVFFHRFVLMYMHTSCAEFTRTPQKNNMISGP